MQEKLIVARSVELNGFLISVNAFVEHFYQTDAQEVFAVISNIHYLCLFTNPWWRFLCPGNQYVHQTGMSFVVKQHKGSGLVLWPLSVLQPWNSYPLLAALKQSVWVGHSIAAL